MPRKMTSFLPQRDENYSLVYAIPPFLQTNVHLIKLLLRLQDVP